MDHMRCLVDQWIQAVRPAGKWVQSWGLSLARKSCPCPENTNLRAVSGGIIAHPVCFSCVQGNGLYVRIQNNLWNMCHKDNPESIQIQSHSLTYWKLFPKSVEVYFVWLVCHKKSPIPSPGASLICFFCLIHCSALSCILFYSFVFSSLPDSLLFSPPCLICIVLPALCQIYCMPNKVAAHTTCGMHATGWPSLP